MKRKARGIHQKAFTFVRLVALTCALVTTGCIKGTDSSNTETTGKQASKNVTGPVTITLSTPKGVPVLAPVILGSNSVFIEDFANVQSGITVAMGASGGGVRTEHDALVNETWSRGTAVLGSRTQVRGTLHAANRILGLGVTIGALDSAPVFDPPTTLSWTVQYPSSSPGPDFHVLTGQSKTLAPGQYDTVEAHSGGTLTLSTGTYYLTNFDVDPLSTVVLDQAKGPVIIYVSAILDLDGAFSVLGGGNPDLLIVNIGTLPFLVGSVYNGALVAPFTTMTLKAVPQVYTGYFAAKDFSTSLDRPLINYRAPLPILTAAKPSGSTCQQLVAALVPPSQLQASLQRYCNGCASPDDADRDGVQNCLDGCPYDRNKTQPGACGCGTPDTDLDGDGIADCTRTTGGDLCTHDPNNTSPGQCGCLGEPNLRPAGTPCNDTACPQQNATCNGAGVCGDRAACIPATGCRFINYRDTSYWVCQPSGNAGADGGAGATPVTESNAQTACSNKGMTLLRIDSLLENRFIASFITAPIWLGANDIAVSGTWRWSAPGTNNGDQFWSGGPAGTPVGGRFAFWAPDAPGAQRCAAMQPSTGQWKDVNCGDSLGYICEFRVPITRTDGGTIQPPGLPHQPPALSGACVPEQNSGLPASFTELQEAVDASFHDVFVGPAANPPSPTSTATCPDDPLANGFGIGPSSQGGGCQFANVINGFECFNDSDCAQFSGGFVCRQQKDDPNCGDINDPAPACVGHGRCGQIVCPETTGPCEQIEVCNPGSDFDAGLDPGSNLDAQAFDPGSLFGGAVPDAAPTSAYVDPPDGSGTGHSWCYLNPQDPNSVKPAVKPSPNYSGHSGDTAKIKFEFDPDLIFDADATVKSLGEADPHLHAQAKLATSVTLNNFLGQSFHKTIFDASIGIFADRCSINDVDDTRLSVFGLDLASAGDLGLPVIDSRDEASPLHAASLACTRSLNDFTFFADRAKKAFRDAQQLLSQYNSAKAIGSTLAGDLCNQIQVAAANVPFFPGGNDCPVDEPVEITINRFVDYYQAPGTGQIARLQQAQSALADATNALKGALSPISLGFGGDAHEESQTILNVPFTIGPVPMVLQVDVFAQYGVGGGFDLSLSFPVNLFSSPSSTASEVARVGAHVAPFAAAGLSAFVGVGFDLGAISATIGIEGAVTLGNVSAPIFAGAGLDEQVLSDARPVPADILPAVVSADAFQFGVPKSFKFFVTYEYGAGVDLTNVLSGEINGRLRIKFFFFSRTWRKRVVKFNGWSKHFDLISGGSDPSVSSTSQTVNAHLNTANNAPDTVGVTTNVASGAATMGLSESQVPLMILKHLTIPPPTDDAGTEAGAPITFDAGAVQKFFYDDLCCLKSGEFCNPNAAARPGCCPGLTCPAADPDAGILFVTCVPECKQLRQKCAASSDCCQTDGGAQIVCNSLNVCAECTPNGQFCVNNSECCSGLECQNGSCQKPIEIPR